MIRVTVGLGCDRGASLETLQDAVARAFQAAELDLGMVTALATIDKKRDEPAILSLAAHYGWPLQFFSAETLAQVQVPSPSETVRKYMGTPAVAEAAALLAADTRMNDLLMEKFKHRGNDGKHATISIAVRRSVEVE